MELVSVRELMPTPARRREERGGEIGVGKWRGEIEEEWRGERRGMESRAERTGVESGWKWMERG